MGRITDQDNLNRYYENLATKVAGWDQKIGHARKRHALLRVFPVDQLVGLVLVVPAVVHLLISLVNDDQVSRKTRYKIYLALGYFLFPLDLIPEAVVGPIGYIDDVVIALRLIDTILNGDNEQEIARIGELWQRSPEELDKLRTLVRNLDLIQHFGKRINKIFK